MLDRDTVTEAEAAIWSSLEMDALGVKMASPSHAPTAHVVMGTTRTQNACNQCGNSSKTAGCGGC